MDDRRFDTLARTLAGSASRRRVLAALAGSAFAGAAGVLGPGTASAGKRGKGGKGGGKGGGGGGGNNRCRKVGTPCTKGTQCCGKLDCSERETCCSPEGEQCEFNAQCCGNLLCFGNPDGIARCGPL